MIKSINYWSFPGGVEGTKRLEDCFSEAKEAGFDAVELCCAESGKLTPKTTERQCNSIRRKAEDADIAIAAVTSSLFWGCNLASPRTADRNRAVQLTKKMLQIAQWLGVDALVFMPGAVDVYFEPEAEVVSYDVVYARARTGIKRLLRTAEDRGVTLCIENVWNKFLLSPLEMRDFIDGFESEAIGACMNVGNALAYGYPEQWIRILGKRVRRVKFKDYKRGVGVDGFCDLLAGDADWPQVMKALKAVEYDGPCTAEIMPLNRHAPSVRIRNTSTAMDAILAM